MLYYDKYTMLQCKYFGSTVNIRNLSLVLEFPLETPLPTGLKPPANQKWMHCLYRNLKYTAHSGI